MPGRLDDDREFVCLEKEGDYKFMLLGDLRDRLLWTEPKEPKGAEKLVAPDCYKKDREGKSTAQLWEREGHLWQLPKPTEDSLWREWFYRTLEGKPNDSAQWNQWKVRAGTAENSNSLLGFPKFARFWNPKTAAHFFFEPANTDLRLKPALDAAIEELKTKWKSCPTCDVVEHDKGKEHGRVLWATHHFEFYNIWVSPEHHQALSIERQDLSRWTPPSEPRALLMDQKTRVKTDTKPTFLNAKELQQSSAISKDKMEKAIGMRKRVVDQGTVMLVGPSEMCETLFGQPAKQLSNGLWPAEWLHRSAFSFGGLGTDDGYESSQTRANLVLGISESNTYMVLLENTISDYVTRTNKSGTLTTTIKYNYTKDPDSTPWKGKGYTWLAPTLEYKFSLDNPIVYKTTPPTPPIRGFTANVETFSLRLTPSLEARASYYFLAKILASMYSSKA
ncbi:hypothetical protein C8R45DRAFT_1102938 [Mycena sanguinolenta]|nr:hypothetical protein C8R45DRAFT_1102938 [Mycena sanguinolenta]